MSANPWGAQAAASSGRRDNVMAADAVVVGAGFAGAVVARELADAGKKVLILEKRGQIGGNMAEAADENGIRIHRYGPHILHTNNRAVLDWLSRFSAWEKYEHRVLCMIRGKAVPLPFNFTSIELLFPEAEAARLKAALLGAFPGGERVAVSDLLRSGEKAVFELGTFVYRNVFTGYTKKQWGAPVEKVNEVVLRRVPVNVSYDDRYFDDAFQVRPREGYTALFQRILDHKNIAIHLDREAGSVMELGVPGEILLDGKPWPGIVVYTGAPDALLACRHGRLPYRSIDFRFHSLPRTEYQAAAVVNYPNDEAFTRVTEFKKLTGQRKDGVTTILKEYPCACERDGQEPYYPIENPENRGLYESYRAELTSWKRLFLCGRLAEYRYYNMDAVIAKALSLAEELKGCPKRA